MNVPSRTPNKTRRPIKTADQPLSDRLNHTSCGHRQSVPLPARGTKMTPHLLPLCNLAQAQDLGDQPLAASHVAPRSSHCQPSGALWLGVVRACLLQWAGRDRGADEPFRGASANGGVWTGDCRDRGSAWAMWSSSWREGLCVPELRIWAWVPPVAWSCSAEP